MKGIQILNIDLNKNTLIDFMDILKGEEYSKSEKRDVIDELDMRNITFILRGINMLQYTILTTFKNYKLISIERKMEFEYPEFENEYLENEYKELIKTYKEIRKVLKNKYKVSKKIIEYFEPMSRLIDIKVSMTLKEFMVFIKTCNKYDELIDVSVGINDDEMLSNFFTVLEYVKTEELFLRQNFIEMEEDFKVLSNKRFIYDSLVRNNKRVKVSSMAHMSFVAFRDINNIPINFDIRLANPKHVGSEDIRLITFDRLPEMEEDDLNLIDKYLYDWIVFHKKVKNDMDKSEVINLCTLGCFGNIVGMNSMYSNYDMLRTRLNRKRYCESKNIIENILNTVERL